MNTFLSVVALVSGAIGAIYFLVGPAFVGPIWWVITLLSLVAIPMLNLLNRITRATEKLSAEAVAQASMRPTSPPPMP